MSRSLIILVLVLTLALPATSLLALATTEDLAEARPTSFVSDPSNWLPRNTQEPLESFLRARSIHYETDVFVLLQPPPSRSLEVATERLIELGNRWTKKNWAIVSYNPGQIGAPIIVSGGPFQKDVNPDFWENEFLLLQQIALQSWGDKPDINALARDLSDSICFASHAKGAATEIFAQRRNQQRDEQRRALKARKALLTTIAAASFLALIAGIFIFRKIYLARRKMHFPSTSWPQRLGAPHSGGSSVNQRFTPPKG